MDRSKRKADEELHCSGKKKYTRFIGLKDSTVTMHDAENEQEQSQHGRNGADAKPPPGSLSLSLPFRPKVGLDSDNTALPATAEPPTQTMEEEEQDVTMSDDIAEGAVLNERRARSLPTILPSYRTEAAFSEETSDSAYNQSMEPFLTPSEDDEDDEDDPPQIAASTYDSHFPVSPTAAETIKILLGWPHPRCVAHSLAAQTSPHAESPSRDVHSLREVAVPPG
jgi:hypothetical protein